MRLFLESGWFYMARNLNRSKAEFNLRCKYYKPDYVNDERLEKGDLILGVFYAKKLSERLITNYNGSTKNIDIVLELETRDNITLAGDYYVELPDGLVYRVADQSGIYIDDRARKDTTLTLRRRME